MAVERVREGERPSAVITGYGFHRCVIYRWIKALRSTCGTGCPRRLTPARSAAARSQTLGTSVCQVPQVAARVFLAPTALRSSKKRWPTMALRLSPYLSFGGFSPSLRSPWLVG